MRKLIDGVRTFHADVSSGGGRAYESLAAGQTPKTLFFACSDSRVVPAFLSTAGPGELFTVRNVGNLVPPAGPRGASTGDRSEASAIEYAVEKLGVDDVVICGHSGCGAMAALDGGGPLPRNLERWLDLARPVEDDAAFPAMLGGGRPRADQLSQRNVLVQLRALATYPSVKERVDAGGLRLHGWWFDIGRVRVDAYDVTTGRFTDFDDVYPTGAE